MNCIEKFEDSIMDAIYIVMINDNKWLFDNMPIFYEKIKPIIRLVRLIDMKSGRFGDKEWLFKCVNENLNFNFIKIMITKAQDIQDANRGTDAEKYITWDKISLCFV
jgi:hypothetical protein